MVSRFGRLSLVLLVAHLVPRLVPRSFASDLKPQRVSLPKQKQMARDDRMMVLEELFCNNSHSEILPFLSDCLDSWVHHVALERCQPKLTLQVYEQMRRLLPEPDALALRLALNACVQLRDGAALRKLIAHLEAQQLWDSKKTVETALAAADAAGEVTTAARIMDQMTSNRIAVEGKHFSSAIAAAARKEPPSPGAANYFMQELMRQAPVKAAAVRDLLRAQRYLPLSSQMSSMRSVLWFSNRSARICGHALGRKRPGSIRPPAAEVMLASVLGQNPRQLNQTQLSEWPRKRRSALRSLLEDFRSANVTLPKRSEWIWGLLRN